jgi:putative endonuclease
MSLVYVIKSVNANWFYVGSTDNLSTRIEQHNQGQVRSTKVRRPFVVVYTEEYDDIGQARKRERFLKDCRIEKEKIIKALSSNG